MGAQESSTAALRRARAEAASMERGLEQLRAQCAPPGPAWQRRECLQEVQRARALREIASGVPASARWLVSGLACLAGGTHAVPGRLLPPAAPVRSGHAVTAPVRIYIGLGFRVRPEHPRACARLGARQVEGDAVAAALRAQLDTAAQRASDANAGVAGCAPECQGLKQPCSALKLRAGLHDQHELFVVVAARCPYKTIKHPWE